MLPPLVVRVPEHQIAAGRLAISANGSLAFVLAHHHAGFRRAASAVSVGQSCQLSEKSSEPPVMAS